MDDLRRGLRLRRRRRVQWPREPFRRRRQQGHVRVRGGRQRQRSRRRRPGRLSTASSSPDTRTSWSQLRPSRTRGSLVVDGSTLTYAGLEPTDVSAANVTIDGGEDGNPSPVPQGDTFKVSPYTDADVCDRSVPDSRQLHPGTELRRPERVDLRRRAQLLRDLGHRARSRSTAGLAPTTPSSRATTSSRARTSPSTPRRSRSTPASRSTSAPETSTSTRRSRTTGSSSLGIDTTLLGDGASIELDGATLNGATRRPRGIRREREDDRQRCRPEPLRRRRSPSRRRPRSSTTGKFTIAGVTGTCSYTGTTGRTTVHRDHRLHRHAR